MRIALVTIALLVVGVVLGGLIGLCISLPPSNVECSDDCGGHALLIALYGALGGAVLASIIAWCMEKARAGRS